MIVVTVERWDDPHGHGRTPLGRIKITNDSTGTEEVGNYEVSVATKGKTTQHLRIEGHRRAGGFWLLAMEALKKFVHPTVTFGSGGRPSVPPR